MNANESELRVKASAMHQTMLRRDFLLSSASGLGALAMSDLFADPLLPKQGDAVANPLLARSPHFPGKAKNCIFIFNAGAPSQLDLFDYKPKLNEHHGQPLPDSLTEGVRFAFLQKETARLMGSNRKFKQHGQSGMWFSDAIPHIADCADDICMIRSMQTDQFNHHPGQLLMQCGQAQFGLPSMGAWLSYGLGTENQNLPSYVVLNSGRGPSGGSTLWHNGFLPSVHAGVLFRNQGAPILNLERPIGLPPELERKGLDLLGDLNQQRFQIVQDSEISSRIANYELAYRMQMAAPELTDLSGESNATLESYGVDRLEPKKRSGRVGTGNHYATFGANCLLARRLVERGVRFVNIMFASWDHHSNLDAELGYNAACVDQPIGALIKDLKHRGLLDDTLVVWGGEFGRTPLGENRVGRAGVTGRDHHPNAFSLFMAGGGSKPGHVYGETDELGWAPVIDPVHINDFQATLLHMFGMDHLKLTFRHQGIDKRLTSITRESSVIHELLA
ncbi:MAG: DUF1501 domain-containing protein [Verrucomicrobia bacterium]|jgi:hypothetical protein|nr:DUF1501 domain-containing protein [Verrucomicrobiota bacterium]